MGAASAQKKSTHSSPTCRLCGATIIVWKRHGCSAWLLRALAVANHVQTLHGTTPPRLSEGNVKDFNGDFTRWA